MLNIPSAMSERKGMKGSGNPILYGSITVHIVWTSKSISGGDAYTEEIFPIMNRIQLKLDFCLPRFPMMGSGLFLFIF